MKNDGFHVALTGIDLRRDDGPFCADVRFDLSQKTGGAGLYHLADLRIAVMLEPDGYPGMIVRTGLLPPGHPASGGRASLADLAEHARAQAGRA